MDRRYFSNEEFIKTYNEESYKGQLFEVDVQYLDYMNFIMIYHFYQKE